jgi:hypothetical protein
VLAHDLVHLAATGAIEAAAAPAPRTEVLNDAQLQMQQHMPVPVHPGLQLTSGSVPLEPAAAVAQGVTAAGGVAVAGVPVTGMLPYAQPVLAAGPDYLAQQQQQTISAAGQLQVRPGVVAAPAAQPPAAAAAAAAGDGADSCTEAVTPLSAPWTHCMAG